MAGSSIAYGPGKSISCTVVYAVDGDTLAATCGETLERIRLIGIDTPESHPNKKAKQDAKKNGRTLAAELLLGRKTANYVQGIVHEGEKITVVFDKEPRSRDGWLLGYVYSEGGRMLNRRILEAGYAVPMRQPPNTRHAALFKSLFHEARSQGRGLWAR